MPGPSGVLRLRQAGWRALRNADNGTSNVLRLLADLQPEGMTMSDAVMTESAQETARRWIDADIERAGRLSLLVSGEAEQDEILTTIRAMIEAKDAEIARLRAALQE